MIDGIRRCAVASRSMVVGLLLSVAASPTMAQQSSAAQSQWFTGPLVAPSPALSTSGTFSVEPYALYTGNTGSYSANWGHVSVPHDLNSALSETVIEYGITDRLSIQATPTIGGLWTGQNASFGIGDLPVELKYRFSDGSVATGSPSVTVFLGMTLPLGTYDRLSVPSVGTGSGAFSAKEGVLLQSLLDTWGDHPLRLRVYADAYEPVASVTVRDVSVYGTVSGFRGAVTPGFSADAGIGVEYGLNRSWVLALDVVQNFTDTATMSGSVGTSGAVTTRNPSSIGFSLAPAVEYNFSGAVGLIVGVQFSVAGRNTASYVAPQVAISVSF